MRNHTWALLLVPLLAFAAKFPEGVPTAMIRFTANDAVIVMPMCERDKFIAQSILNNNWVKELSPVTMFGTRPDKNSAAMERLIPADRTLLFRMRWGHATFHGDMNVHLQQCERIFSITPAPGEQYHARYEHDANGCLVTLYRLSMANGVVQETQVPLVDDLPDDRPTFEVCGKEGRRRVL